MLDEKIIRILGADPGKSFDYFAIVYIDVRNDKIYIRGCKAWVNIPYTESYNYIENLHKNKIHFDHIAVESNAMGTPVVDELLYNRNMPIIGVHTGGGNKENSMAKDSMVAYILGMQEDGRMLFPPKETDDEYMSELRRQWSIFEERRSLTGKYQYSAPSGEHDDYVMALMLACFIARRYLSNEPATLILKKNEHKIKWTDLSSDTLKFKEEFV